MVEDAIGIAIQLEIEIDLAAALMDVRRHGVPHRSGLEHGQAHDQLRAVADAGDDELEDGALVRFLQAAALQRIGVGDAELAGGERLVRRAGGEIETRAGAGELHIFGAHRHIEAILGAQREDCARRVGRFAGPACGPLAHAGHIRPPALARAISDRAADDAIIVTDTAEVTLWASNWWRQSGRQLGTGLPQWARGLALQRARSC